MAQSEAERVTMRIRLGGNELEVTGPKGFVEEKIEEFIKLNKPASSARVYMDANEGAPAKSAGDMGKPLSAAQLFKKASPRTDVDRALLAGYFLENHSDQECFTAAEVKDTIRAAKITPPKNPNAAVDKNIKKGLMMPAGDKDGKKAFVLTSDGEDSAHGMLGE